MLLQSTVRDTIKSHERRSKRRTNRVYPYIPTLLL